MIEKTVHIYTLPTQATQADDKAWKEFVDGFLSSSNWKTIEGVGTAANVGLFFMNDFSVDIYPRLCVKPNEVIHNCTGVLRDLFGTYRISIPSCMKFSEYLEDRPKIATKSFIGSIPKYITSPHGIGYEFGLFAADAINEENWQEYLKNKSKPEREDE